MEFSFDTNHIFTDRITIVDQTVFSESPESDILAHIGTVIDELGRASATAQKLRAPVTSASKLQYQKNQIYILNERENNGHGVILGFLKVGYKKLFLFDKMGVYIEAEPLCALDFYVVEKFQRQGYGLELFDSMLKHNKLDPVLLAYDRPTHQFQSFLTKHYGLTRRIPQANNFMVFEGFFPNRTAAQLRKAPLKKTDRKIKSCSSVERHFFPPHASKELVSSPGSHSLSRASSHSRVSPQVPTVSDCGDKDQITQSPLLKAYRVLCTRQQAPGANCSLNSQQKENRETHFNRMLKPGRVRKIQGGRLFTVSGR
ncbi:alpha-tubulin N-acetyltransferase 1 isoform X1 [Solea senegalensis]|uniref:Alpha-tubulin N-acetyltransferase 1 n=1 Tax=Solea senegalensis TaxID=28829 RepID=A0AAV6RWY4_SOLSE|nr:alpha-tubulin N-acetyltransferase 1-like [Solea senegalensis]KAG7509906.1 alpha-tubulin N-acetyltransferase 1 isoform X1 [Solea senegalensis]